MIFLILSLGSEIAQILEFPKFQGYRNLQKTALFVAEQLISNLMHVRFSCLALKRI